MAITPAPFRAAPCAEGAEARRTRSELAPEIGIPPNQFSALVAGLREEKLIVKRGAGYAPKQ
jgi:hypothetical protein